MLAYSLYKVLHILGVATLFLAIGGNTLHAAIGGKREENRLHGLVGALHGVGALLIVVAGFAMLASFDFSDKTFPLGWVLAKILIWLFLGGWLLAPYRWPGAAKHLLPLLPLFAALAAFLALVKPF
jgi:hypothetical protein